MVYNEGAVKARQPAGSRRSDKERQMANITIPLGAKVIIERPDGTVEVYTLRGGNPIMWEEPEGGTHTHVLEEPYNRIQVIHQ